MDVRPVLERLEELDGRLEPQLAYLAVEAVDIDPDELRGARRRALLVLASGGDPLRELDPEGRAVAVVARDVDAPGRRARLREALSGLRTQAGGLAAVTAALDGLLADDEAAWRWAACALLAEELA